MNGLEMINASSAYARGATGDGVRVGVIDSGAYQEHAEFAQGEDSKVTIAGSDYSDQRPRTDEAIGHGTVVAGVIAANRDNNNLAAVLSCTGSPLKPALMPTKYHWAPAVAL